MLFESCKKDFFLEKLTEANLDKIPEILSIFVSRKTESETIMRFDTHYTGHIKIAEIHSDGLIIGNIEDALNVLGDAYYQGYDGIILYERNITPDFFDLQTKLAGEILQKFSNYRMRLVIVGDWSKYTSRSLEAFICESNKGKTVNFSSSLTEALKLLSRIN